MSRFSLSRLVLFAVASLVSSVGSARATCVIPTAGYQGGAYGAYAVTTGACAINLDANGGAESTNAAASSSLMGDDGSGTFLLSSTADLTTGILTAASQSGFASASIWESFTYTGLPAGGATITATLSLPGTLTGSSTGFAWLEEGSEADFNDGTELFGPDDPAFFNTTGSDPKPSSISLSFNVANGTTVIVFAEIQAIGDSLGGVANLGDPPTLTLTLPAGASVTTASGDFVNFTSAAVPEPSTWAMMLLGFAGLGFAGYRRSLPSA